MLRSTRRVTRHMELVKLLILHPKEGKAAAEEVGVNGTPTQREEKLLIQNIKERLNGSAN